MTEQKHHIFIALSGGVDSSVAAHLLRGEGHRVTGLFMRNWNEEGGGCGAAVDADDVARVCEQLNIDFHVCNFTERYWDRVFAEYLAGLRGGITPNPDVLCNREIKFRSLFERARQLGADFLATGHYCRIERGERSCALLKGSDPLKDQSYFLHAVSGEVLRRTLFPLGDLTKPRVRAIAAEQNLPVATKRESMGICFIGKRKHRPFMSQYLPTTPGPIANLRGDLIGEHSGLGFYTIGQRRGLDLGGGGPSLYVVDKEIERNRLVVAPGIDHPALFHNALWARDLHWVTAPPRAPLICAAKIRYRQAPAPCSIEVCDERGTRVRFKSPQRAITPGQSIVFYHGERCLGGGMIHCRWVDAS